MHTKVRTNPNALHISLKLHLEYSHINSYVYINVQNMNMDINNKLIFFEKKKLENMLLDRVRYTKSF